MGAHDLDQQNAVEKKRSKTCLAPVTPSVLAWARNSISASLEDAASKVGVKPERVEKWERGEEQPTVAMLRKLAEYYMQPLALFFLSEIPDVADKLPDFRRLNIENKRGSWDRSMHKVYRRALMQREGMTELLRARSGLSPLEIPFYTIEADPEVAGAVARETIGITAINQSKWANTNKLPEDLVDSIEELGILILRTSEVPLKMMRGFSLSDGEILIVVVNALDSWRGQVFTLAHEFAHLMLREGGVCDLFGPDDLNSCRVERWCNKVAGAMLMPKDIMLADTDVFQGGEREWSDSKLQDLGRAYGVSWEAILIRLVDLGRASQEFCDAKRQGYLTWHLEQRNQEKKKRQDRVGGPSPVTMVVRDRGRAYVREVLNAYHSGIITLWSLTEMLELRTKHLSKLEERAIDL